MISPPFNSGKVEGILTYDYRFRYPPIAPVSAGAGRQKPVTFAPGINNAKSRLLKTAADLFMSFSFLE
ncbi:MAG TPA: hypothetical protein VJ161_08340 [Geobacteraceae bacterium]|nr:hypothetical protein [Geobacteraceae bacterium]